LGKSVPNLAFEKDFWQFGRLVAGVDEAGRGALAGPVFAAAVVYPLDYEPDFEVFDSKTISARKREELYEKIIASCLAWAVAKVDAEEIDAINILRATFRAMKIAIEKINHLEPFCLIDGNRFDDGGIPHKTIIDGDARCFSIASASIIAKVERDRWMVGVAHKLYPLYGFDHNKGYGTKYHIEKILEHNITPLHRKTYLSKILTTKRQTELI
jgi:ribonuclease HII